MEIPYPTEEQQFAANQYVQSMREFENEVLQDKSNDKDVQAEQESTTEAEGFHVSKELLLSNWPDFVVTEDTREVAKKHPNITDVRLRSGRFRTDEEEERRRLLREKPLPGEEVEDNPKVRKKSLWTR